METCLEKFRYLTFRRINSLSSCKKMNAIVTSKDTSFHFDVVVRRPLSDLWKRVVWKRMYYQLLSDFFQCRFSFELNSRPFFVHNFRRLCKNILREI